jgi:hypothetical protein
MNEVLPILFAAYPPVLCGVALAWLLGGGYGSRLRWAVRALACTGVVVFAFLAGSWAFTSVYLRYVALGLLAAVLVLSYRRMQRGDRRAATHTGLNAAAALLVFFLFSALNALALTSYCPSGATLDVAFPLRSGTYAVLQGGASAVTNPFHWFYGSRLAMDIVKLNAFGNRAAGIAPRALPDYAIFGDKLYSPCQGGVDEVRDGLPDNPPGNPDLEHSAGNYIILNCAGVAIIMAHLKRGSVGVTPGENLTVGQPLAEIGNSGNTLEPHLHIEARQDGREVTLTFNGRPLSANSAVRAR